MTSFTSNIHRSLVHFSIDAEKIILNANDLTSTKAEISTLYLECLHYLDFPRVNLSTYGGRAFAYAGPTSWNSLPDNPKNVNLSLQTFKRHLKTFFFSSY